jgi:hypothetical protein
LPKTNYVLMPTFQYCDPTIIICHAETLLFASATKNPYKTDLIRVTLSPNKKKEEVLWDRSDSIKSRSWLY